MFTQLQYLNFVKNSGSPKTQSASLQKAAYGLVIAPLSWYKSVHSYLKELGFVRCRSDPCLWILFGQSTTSCGGKETIGIICGHIDDFLFGGDANDKRWTTIKEKIKQRFWWGDWESNDFVQCSTRITQRLDYGFELDQIEYCEEINKIDLEKD